MLSHTFLAKLETEDMLYQTKSGTLFLAGSGLLSFLFYEFFRRGVCTIDGYIVSLPEPESRALVNHFCEKDVYEKNFWYRKIIAVKKGLSH